MVEVLKGGSQEMARIGAEARRLGLVVSDDLLANAERMNDELQVASKILDMNFKQALVSLAPLLISTAQLVGGLASAVGGLVDQLAGLENRSTSALEGRLATLQELLATVGTDVTTPDGQIVPANPMAMSIGGADVTALQQEKVLIEGILAARKSIATLSSDTRTSANNYTAESNAAAAAAIKQGEAVKSLIADLEFEKSLVGESAIEQRILTAQRQAGVAAASEQGLAIRDLITDLEASQAAFESNAAAMDALKNVGKDVLSGFVTDLREGVSATEALGNAFGRLSQRLLDMAMDQAINALLSTLMGSLTGSVGGIGGLKMPGGLNGGTGGFSGSVKMSAKGNVFSGPGISAYSNKIVSSPTLFPFAKGIGLMGELGAEATMPLTRDSRGRLGVTAAIDGPAAAANGGGRPPVVVNVTFNGVTDMASFQKSRAQITTSLARAVGGARRFN